MGGTIPICPFCKNEFDGLKQHIKDKHPDRYDKYIKDDQPPYWRYDETGNLKDDPSCTSQ